MAPGTPSTSIPPYSIFVDVHWIVVCIVQTVLSDDEAKMGKLRDPAPRFVGNIIAWLLNLVSGSLNGISIILWMKDPQ